MRVLFVVSFLIHFSAFGQPATEVWLFDFSPEGKASNPVNVSDNPGKYDNQPSFTRGGNRLLFTATRGDQTDILSYALETGEKEWLTNTEGSEYSPIQIPGSYEFSTIVLEKNGRQLLWKYSLNGGSGEILVPFLKIGYHAWTTENDLFAFVLGPHSTFQLIDVKAKRAEIIQEDIGRSIQYVSDLQSLFFIDNAGERPIIKRLNVEDGELQAVGEMLSDSQDMAVMSDGVIYSGRGSQLYQLKSSTNGNQDQNEWELVQDLAASGIKEITRLAINPSGNKLAIVTEE